MTYKTDQGHNWLQPTSLPGTYSPMDPIARRPHVLHQRTITLDGSCVACQERL